MVLKRSYFTLLLIFFPGDWHIIVLCFTNVFKKKGQLRAKNWTMKNLVFTLRLCSESFYERNDFSLKCITPITTILSKERRIVQNTIFLFFKDISWFSVFRNWFGFFFVFFWLISFNYLWREAQLKYCVWPIHTHESPLFIIEKVKYR